MKTITKIYLFIFIILSIIMFYFIYNKEGIEVQHKNQLREIIENNNYTYGKKIGLIYDLSINDASYLEVIESSYKDDIKLSKLTDLINSNN